AGTASSVVWVSPSAWAMATAVIEIASARLAIAEPIRKRIRFLPSVLKDHRERRRSRPPIKRGIAASVMGSKPDFGNPPFGENFEEGRIRGQHQRDHGVRKSGVTDWTCRTSR